MASLQPQSSASVSDAEHSRRLEWIDAATSAVVAVASDYPDGHNVALHRHVRGQLLHALCGVLMVSTRQGRWMVPADHAMWIPAGVEHAVEMLGEVRMRSAYVLPAASAELPVTLRVVAMTDLMRSLVVEAVEIDHERMPDRRAEAIMHLMLIEIPRLRELPFALPLPRDTRLAKLCRAFVDHPSPHAAIDDWAASAGMSRRSFTRAFQRETGITLSMWRRQATLFAALPRLAEGKSVTSVALDLGYESAPAFTTMFRQMLGASPRDWLRRQGGAG